MINIINKFSQAKDSDFIIINPDITNWYNILEWSSGKNVLVLDRFINDIFIISEKKMNELGWYRK